MKYVLPQNIHAENNFKRDSHLISLVDLNNVLHCIYYTGEYVKSQEKRVNCNSYDIYGDLLIMQRQFVFDRLERNFTQFLNFHILLSLNIKFTLHEIYFHQRMS
jgi:hypothetical protein